MSQITLKPLDDGQKAVEIPLGKTTIGRGSLLGCSDKKVSRNHAVLEVTSQGEIYLTPTHVNPCFYQPTADSPGQILKKDVPYKLANGDSFSLLPRAYRYQLIIEGEPSQNETTDQNDVNKQLGKVNGSAADHLDGATTNEELSDSIVHEKAFTKEETPSVEKSGPQEENTFSKRIPEIENNDSTKDCLKADSAEHTEDNHSLGNNNVSPEHVASPAQHLEDGREEVKADALTARSEPEANESSDEGYEEAFDKPSVDRVSEENDSTLNLDSVPKTLDKEEKPEIKLSIKFSDTISKDEPECESAPAEAVSNNQSSCETTSKSSQHEEKEVPSAKTTKKKAPATRQLQKERRAPKQNAVSGSPPKTKGRKKSKLSDGEGTSRQPGRTSSRTNRQTRQGLSLEDFIVSDDDEWQSDRSEPRRKRGKRRADDSGSDWETEHKKPKKPLHKVLSGSESGSDRNSQRKKWPKGRRKKGKASEKPSETASEEEPQPSSSSHVKLRIPCTYAKKCFRRNPNHKDQFSHPGDSDYTSEPETNPKNNDAISESEEDIPKKECPYGVNCFRKNPQHKKDFKHTKKVRPQREAAKQADKKTKSTRNSDEVDSYDLNDSFLNDDSDEYKPVDSGSDYESGEKIKRLVKMKGSKSKKGKKV